LVPRGEPDGLDDISSNRSFACEWLKDVGELWEEQGECWASGEFSDSASSGRLTIDGASIKPFD
jgi:hypothetical protein